MRRKSRELAFRVLFEHEVGRDSLEAAWEHSIGLADTDEPEEGEDPASIALDEEAIVFAKQLVDGYQNHQNHINAVLTNHIEGWSFGQMAKTDLSLLRIACYEMLAKINPPPIVIEAVLRIAKRYGGEDSSKFINAVLGKITNNLEDGTLEWNLGEV